MSDLLVVLISGANQGIGFQAAKLLAKTNKYQVLVGSRDLSKGQAAIESLLEDKDIVGSNLRAIQLDISSDDSIKKAAEYVGKQYGHLDILINNAAVVVSRSAGVTLREEYRQTFDTNVFSHAVMTEEFLPLIKKSTAKAPTKRIVFTTSALGSLTLASSNSEYAQHTSYSSSKSALNMMMVHYAHALGKEGICVTSVCPGYCATGMNGYSGPNSAESGAKAVVDAATSGGMEINGKAANAEGVLPW